MLKRTIFTGVTALSMTLAAPINAQSASDVVATVNGEDITLGEMIIARTRLPQQYAQLPANVLWEGLLDQLTQQALLASTASEPPLRVELALKNERRSLLAGEAINTLMSNAVTEEAIQAAYDARFDGAPVGEEFNASHLLVETEEEALAALARIEGGAEFADVARDVSTGPTGPNGGNLGWFGPGQMVPPFEAAVMELEVDGVSGPVQTQFGWHIVKLNEKRKQEQPGLEDLREELSIEIQTQTLDAHVADLKAQATITQADATAFDPNVLTDLSLLEPDAE